MGDVVIEDDLLGGHQQIVAELLSLIGRIGHRDMTVPRVVLLTGESGTGKSRIIREVYENLLSTQPAPKYWTDLEGVERGAAKTRVDPMKARKELGPRPEASKWEALSVPEFGWWTFSCDRSSTDNPSNVVAEAASQLAAHLPALTVAWRKKTGWFTKAQTSFETALKEVQDASIDEGIDAALNKLDKIGIEIPVASTILRVLTNTAAFAKGRIGERQEFRSDVDTGMKVEGKKRSAGEDLAEVIRSLTYAPSREADTTRESLRGTPLPGIVLVEDAHLMDEGFAAFLDAVSVHNAANPVLVIATAWPEGFSNEVFENWVEGARAEPGYLSEVSVPKLATEDLIRIVRRYASKTSTDHAEKLVARLNTPHFLKLWLTLEYTRIDIEENGEAVIVDDELLARLPEDVVEVLQMRWNELPFETKKVLELAAVATQDLSGLPQFLGEVLLYAAEDARLSPELLVEGLEFAANPAAWCRTVNEIGSFREVDLQDVARASAFTRDSRWHPKTVERARASVVNGLKLWISSRLGDNHLLENPDDDAVVTAALWLTGITPEDQTAEYTAAQWVIASQAAQRYDYATAIDHGSAVSTRLSEWDPDHPDTRNVRQSVAQWLSDKGSVAQAIEHLTDLLADRIRVLGSDHPNTLSTRNNLAVSLAEAGQVEQAIRQFTVLLADQIRVLGPDNLGSLLTRNNLALALGRAGQVEQAIEQFTALLADQIRVLGSDHPDTLRTRNNLASWLAEAGQVDQAIGQFTALVADRTRVLGPDHPDTLHSRDEFASSLGQAGRVEQAVEQSTALLADRIRVLGPDHPATLGNRNNLASWLGWAGQVEQAVEQFTALLADLLRVLGPDHPSTLSTRNNLASWLAEAGQVEKAIEQFTAVLADRIRVLGPDHPDTLHSRNDFALALGDAGQVEQAIEHFTALLVDRIRVLGPDDLDTLGTRNNLAMSLGNAGQVEEEMEQFTALLADQVRVVGPDHPDTLSSRNNLAVSMGEAGQVHEAIEQFTSLLAHRIRVLGPDHPDTLGTRHSLAWYLGEAGQVEEAIEQFTALLADRIRVLGPDHRATLRSRDNLASLLGEAGQVEQAV